MTDATPILEITNLKKYFTQSSGFIDQLFGNTQDIQAVDDVSFSVYENESHGVIGESGCGKTTLMKTLVGLQDPTAGNIKFKGKDIADFSRGDWRDFRSSVQIILQDPFNALDPKMRVEETLREQLQIHNYGNQDQRINDVLKDVELTPPERYRKRLPSQLSGGEKQRVSIARALILEPDVLLADEPVSMLDVSTQASALKLLENLIDEYGLSMFYISHDLSTVSYVCDTVHVMYLGRIVESAPTLQLIDDPKHPYSQALVDAIPLPDPYFERGRTEIEGIPRDPIEIGEGCRFRDRCPERMDACEVTPKYKETEEDHRVACHLYYDDPEVSEGEFETYTQNSSTVEQ